MKTLITICLLATLTISAKAQKTDTVPFRKFTKIIIKNNLSQSENFKKCGSALIELGYMIGSKDEQFRQLISGPKKIAWGEQFIYLIAKDNEIVMICKYNNKDSLTLLGGKDESLHEFKYYKNDNNEPELLNNMQKVLKILPRDKVIYSE